MKLVLAGVSARDAAIFGMFLARDLPNWTWQLAPAGPGSACPPADILVLDMVALGLLPHSPVSQAALLQVTQGTPAVLLLPAFERHWATLASECLVSNRLVRLVKPYGTQAMRDALQATAAMVQLVMPVSPNTTALPVKPQPQPQTESPPDAPSLTAAELRVRLDALPSAQGGAFLRQISRLLQQTQPFEARFTVQNSLIVHPVDGWVASNTPLRVIQQVCRSDVLASAVVMRVLDEAQAEERTHSLSMFPTELDAFLWALVSATLPPASPAP